VAVAPEKVLLVDTQVPNMPVGVMTAFVDVWAFPSGSSAMMLPAAADDPNVAMSFTERFVATLDGNEQTLTPHEPFIVPAIASQPEMANTENTWQTSEPISWQTRTG
jgi:hypothetical protein